MCLRRLRGGEPGMDVSRASDPSSSYVISRPIFNLFGDLTTMTTAALEREQRENRLPYDDLTTGEAYRVLPDGVGQIASRFGPRDRPDLDEARTEDDIALHGDERFVPRFRSGRQGGVPQGEDISTQPGTSGVYNTLPKGKTALEPRIKPDLPVEPAPILLPGEASTSFAPTLERFPGAGGAMWSGSAFASVLAGGRPANTARGKTASGGSTWRNGRCQSPAGHA